MCLPLCSKTEMTAVATKQLCARVRGYHVYKDVGASVVGEELVCRKEKMKLLRHLYCISNEIYDER